MKLYILNKLKNQENNRLNYVTYYTLEITTAGTGSGTTTGAGTYNYGDTATTTAIANTGSTFTGWSGPDGAECETGAVLMTANKSCMATFTLNRYTLEITTAGTGSGTTTGKGMYDHGDIATVTATPNLGSTFNGWSGPDGAECATSPVLMTANKSCTATFTLNRYTLEITTVGTGSGTTTGAGMYDHGVTANVTATPTLGSTFNGWSGPDGAECSTGSVSMTANKSCTATFTLIPSMQTLTVSKKGTGSGAVTSSPSGINCGSGCSASYNFGTSVTLTATSTSDSIFTSWEGACAGMGQCVVSMTEARNVTANFTLTPPLSFVLATSFAVNDFMRGMAIADFNKDGKLDLSVTYGCCNGIDTKLSTFLGSGDGFLSPGVTISGTNGGGFGETPITTGDFNNDGNVDLIVSSTGGDPISLLFGDGTGVFVISHVDSCCMRNIATGDFNKDGNLDLALGKNSSFVSVRLGNGTGGFGPESRFGVSNCCINTGAVGDMNRDGNLDLIVSATYDIAVLLGTGSGNFAPAILFNSNAVSEPVLGDFDNDGDLDVVVVGRTGIIIHLGDGTGGLGSATTFPTGGSPRSLAVSDLNRDGSLDIAVINSGCLGCDPIVQGSLAILVGNGDGSFGSATLFSNVGTLPQSVIIGDLNEDEKPDMIITNRSKGTISKNNVSILLNTPDTLNTYTLRITADGTGSGTTSGAGTYNYGSTATVTATADPGSTFDGWSGTSPP